MNRSGLVRIGVVGLGYWGPNVARNIATCQEAELAWACDLDADALEGLARQYPAARTTTAYEEMLDDPALDAVAITTPVTTHHALAASALDAGKHVFVEKPMARSSLEARDLMQRADDKRLVLMPGHTFLYSPPVVKIKELIDAGVLGEIYFISMSRVNLGLHQPDVSVIWDLGPHDFSILRYWLGAMPSEVSALTRSCVFPTTPDIAFINGRYDNDAIVHIELSWLSPSKLRRTAIVGSEKMVVYDDTSSESVRIFDSGAELPNPATFGEFQLSYRTGDIVSPRIEATEPLAVEIADFCSAVTSDSVPRSSAELGLDVIRVIETVERSLEQGGAVVRLDDIASGQR